MPGGRSNWPGVCLLGAVLAACLMRLPGLRLPLERDEGAYAYIAQQWLHGSLPYRDLFDHKPPLLHLLFMPPVVAGWDFALSVRLWAALLFLLGLPLLAAAGRRVWDARTTGLTILLYAIAGSAFSLQGLVLNSEQALILPSLLALLALLRAIELRARRWSLAYGICLGLVALVKPTPAPLLLPLILLVRAPDRGLRFQHLVLTMVGITVPWLPVLAYWLHAGALDALTFSLITYNRLYAAESARQWSAGATIDVLAPLAPLLVAALGGAAFAGWGDTHERQRAAVVLWTFGLLVAAMLGLRAYIHYYVPVLPGLCLLAAPVVTRLVDRAGGVRVVWKRTLAWSAPAMLTLLLVGPFAYDNARLVGLTPAAQAQVLYGQDGRLYFSAAVDVGAYIRRRTSPGQQIFVWASEPEVYLYAGRSTSQRYIYDYPFQLVPAARDEVIRGLRREPAALYVLYHGFLPDGFGAIVDEQHLRLADTIGGYDIWAAP